jgi:hypothetical protein
MILSASSAAAAATQGAGSTCGSVAGSVPVANAPGDDAAHSRAPAAAFRIGFKKIRRIDRVLQAVPIPRRSWRGMVARIGAAGKSGR